MLRSPGPVILFLASVVAVIGARPYAGGWNDGSRLAAVESLGERDTFAIDESVFVRVPPPVPGRPSPYPADRPDLMTHGTLDKLFIDGHFYSDKSPVPTIVMAGLYRVWLSCDGPTFAERPDLTCRFLTVCTSGVAFVFAVYCFLRLGRRASLPNSTLALVVSGIAFATVALPYTRHVNNHILLLGVAAGVCVVLSELNEQPSTLRLVALGTSAGLGYGIDLAAGPLLVAATSMYVALRTRRVGPLVIYSLAAAPWILLHHVLNYSIGGTLGPANAVPEYFRWPGCPFTPESMTGGWKHSVPSFALYAADLLYGIKGIVSNNPTLWLAGLAVVRLGRRDPAVLFTLGWCGPVWLLYAATSNNSSGQCCSVRWFVPFVAPAYWLIVNLMVAEPRFRADLAWLTGIGVCMATLMWVQGPWSGRMVPGLWGWMFIAAAGWAWIHRKDLTRRKIRDGFRLRLLNSRSTSAV